VEKPVLDKSEFWNELNNRMKGDPLTRCGFVSAFFPPLCKDEKKNYHNGF
jgi:hypothetical protein